MPRQFKKLQAYLEMPDFHNACHLYSAKLIITFIWHRGETLACSEAWIDKIGHEDYNETLDINNKSRKCQQRCERQIEIPTFKSSLFPSDSTFSQQKAFCLALIKVSRICSVPRRAKVFEDAYNQTGITCKDILNANNTAKLCTEQTEPIIMQVQGNQKVANFLINYAKYNFAILRVYIKDPYYMLIKRDEQMSFISFLGNTGGLLSLCMGLSLVSIFEIFYHFSKLLGTKLE